MILQQLLNGVTLGSIYALIALGYSLVYGVLRLVNFAHSEIFMIGAFAGLGALSLPFVQSQSAAVQLVVAILAAGLASALMAYLVERLAYRPLRAAWRLSPLISAIGVSILLQNAVFLFISNQSLTFPEIGTVRSFQFGSLNVSSLQILIITLALVLMAALQFFVQKTKLGKAMRAVSADSTTAQLLGINSRSIIALTFFLGGALGGAAGLLNGIYYGSIRYNMGFVPGIKAFTAAVLGGIGSVPGAVCGGFLLGILESLAAGLIPGGSEWKDIFAFIILMLVLLVRPQGIFGEKQDQKV